ncbi:MAG: SDR family oxidoreductase [Rhodospirillum sp.]|nr:SDR family oxidoreductase [Rhodospirillum sp.]MCF8491464.1 SDR family oxidoreductase [Rhodospirillum sp.]MCF8498872.1 SDR family oxidoreductase [Rhodospirillum sp.]
MDRLKGRIVAITGANGGMGTATALLLAERGAKLILGARRTAALDDLIARIRAAGGEVEAASTDVTQPGDLDHLVERACFHYGRLDVLVGTAGAGLLSPLDDLRVDDWVRMVDVNIKGILFGVAAALPVFRSQGGGHFVTIGSTAGARTVPTQAVYSATKFAVRALMEGLRQEAGKDLRVTLITPGFVRTSFVEGIVDGALRADYRIRRDQMAIDPAAIARAIAFALEQPTDVELGEVVVRPTAQA